MHISANLLICERGRDIALTGDEQLVLDAILRENRLPCGCVVLIPEKLSPKVIKHK